MNKEFKQVITDLANQNKEVILDLKNSLGQSNDELKGRFVRISSALSGIEKAITGTRSSRSVVKPLSPTTENTESILSAKSKTITINFEPVIKEIKDQTKILDKLLGEQVLLRKITEGSLLFDKKAGQYRNTAGREVKSIVSGKQVKEGGYVDFETASDRLSGQPAATIERGEKSIERKDAAGSSYENVIKIVTAEIKDLPKELSKEISKLSAFRVKSEEKTLKEDVKETIAAIKLPFKGVKKASEGVWSLGKNLFTDREKFKEQIGAVKSKVDEKAKGLKESIAEVAKVSPDYTAERGRFAEEYKKRGLGTEEQGMEAYKKITDKEQELIAAEKRIKDSEAMGFDPAEEDKAQVEKLKAEIAPLRGQAPESKVEPVSAKPTEVNPEADNIQSSQEIIADNTKIATENSKQSLDVFKEQLDVLKEIRDALNPKTPAEIGKGTTAAAPVTAKEEGNGTSGFSPLDLLPLGGKALKSIGRGAKALGRGALSLGSKLARFASSPTGKIGGAALAVGAGAYTAYKGYTGAEGEKQGAIQDVEQKVAAGEITPEQAAEQKKEIEATATENKGGAIGEGTGMAAGAIGGGIAGAKIGAGIGTFFGGPVGTAIGAGIGTIAGGAIGAISGSSVGKNIGGFIGKGIAGIKGLVGADDSKNKTGEINSDVSTTEDMKFSEDTFAKNDPEAYKEFNDFIVKRQQEILKKDKLYNDPNLSPVHKRNVENIAGRKAKREAIVKFKDRIKTAGASSSNISGDAAQQTDSVSSSKTTPGLSNTNKNVKLPNAVVNDNGTYRNATNDEVVAAKKSLRQGDGTVAIQSASKPVTGLEVAATSVENKDLERQTANKQSSSVQPVISNNVSNNNTTSYVPIKATPRPEFTGSALDRYQSRVAVY
jgi:hypothetical protein